MVFLLHLGLLQGLCNPVTNLRSKYHTLSPHGKRLWFLYSGFQYELNSHGCESLTGLDELLYKSQSLRCSKRPGASRNQSYSVRLTILLNSQVLAKFENLGFFWRSSYVLEPFKEGISVNGILNNNFYGTIACNLFNGPYYK